MELETGLDEVKERYVQFTLVPSGRTEKVLLRNAMISQLVRCAEDKDKSEIVHININEKDIPYDRFMLVVEYMNAMKGEDLPKVPRAPDDLSDIEKHAYYSNLNACYSDNYLSGFGTEEFRLNKCVYEEDPTDKEEEKKIKKERYQKLMANWRYPYKGNFDNARKFVHEYSKRLNDVLCLNDGETEGYTIEIDGKEKTLYDKDVRYVALAAVANWFAIPGLISLAITLFHGSKKF
jgi:hypothetical protein